jgi:chromosomal replication initiator protein
MTITINIPDSSPVHLRDFSLACQIITIVCAHCDLNPSDLESKARPWRIVWPRWMAMFLIRQHTALTFERIGMLFNRDHGSVMNAMEGVKSCISVHRACKLQLNHLSAIVDQAIVHSK